MSLFELTPLKIPKDALSETEHLMFTSLQEIHYLIAKLYGVLIFAIFATGFGGSVFAFFFVRAVDDYTVKIETNRTTTIQVARNAEAIQDLSTRLSELTLLIKAGNQSEGN